MEKTNLTEYILSKQPGKFRPAPIYIEESDSILYFFENTDYYAKRINELFTVYLRMDSDELMGVEIKGIKHLLKLLGSFDIEVKSQKLKIGPIFVAYLVQKSLGTDYSDFMEHKYMHEFRQKVSEKNAKSATVKLQETLI